jgi:hypothetical protein
MGTFTLVNGRMTYFVEEGTTFSATAKDMRVI